MKSLIVLLIAVFLFSQGAVAFAAGSCGVKKECKCSTAGACGAGCKCS